VLFTLVVLFQESVYFDSVIMSSLTVFPRPPPPAVFTICEKNSDLVTVSSAPAQVLFFFFGVCHLCLFLFLLHVF